MENKIQMYFPYDFKSAGKFSLQSINSVAFGYYYELQYIRGTKGGIKPVRRAIFISNEEALLSAESNRTEGTAFRICAINTLFFSGDRNFVFFENENDIEFKDTLLNRDFDIQSALRIISQTNQLWFGPINSREKKKRKGGWDLHSKSYCGNYQLCWTREKSSRRRYKKINRIKKSLLGIIIAGACC
ncbi:hypothetical protein [Allorhizobium taibaishanense]|uniref:Uncharacterized protein n=1 Tax=Allorhizobium taibaishanense TaxID=887144 RepID=A0A1Q9A4D8_9HYPH|nr:hypothetical protein [Allorhizobium taibaishanense]MBB4006505.1 hypothetical protein [Allorhizobium taibaishanense]OLP49439.1 hypothetical protein BJF91_20595 [Allorhizobium taibaishanense]